MSCSFRDILQDLRNEYKLENERIKEKILQVEESLDWEEVPKGRNKRDFYLLNSREAKLKTISTLRQDLINKADEMEEFQNRLQEILKTPEDQAKMIKIQREIVTFKKRLPVYRFRTKVLESVWSNDVTVLVADTGSGKSTLIPQFIFEHDESLVTYCAQPRKLAAHGLADYTRDCLNLSKGDATLATDFSSWDSTYDGTKSRIVYTTNFGLLNKWRSNKSLSDVDVVVIDEAHERNLATDLLLGIMKEVLSCPRDARPRPLKLLVMSATIDPDIFLNFFRSEAVSVNNLNIPGKTFPVEMIYDKLPLSDNPRDYLERTLAKVKEVLADNESGDILVFLATPSEIDEGVDKLEEFMGSLGRSVKAFPLHGNVESEAQRALFRKEDPSQQRVILSTKIAETSVTLPDIMFVIDSGRQKEFSFDLVKNIGELCLSKISKTSAIQRAGRAGRVGPGVCFRLYQLKDFEEFVSSNSPEIRCLPLDQSLLSLFNLGFSSPSSFNFIDPPDPVAVKVGISSLLSLDAILKPESSEDIYELTHLGSKMAKFNIDPRLAHLIVNTVEHQEKWIPEILVICGMVSSGGNVFYRYGNYEVADFQKLKFCHPSGDFITMLEAFKRWSYVPQSEKRTWAKRNYISSKALGSVRKFVNANISQILRTFRYKNLGHLRNFEFSVNHESYDPILKLIYGSFKRSLAVFAGHYQTGYVSPVTSQRMVLHPSSSINKLGINYPTYICYDKVLTTNRTSIFHASMVRPEWIEDEASLYTEIVKASLVERHDDYPRLGTKLIKSRIMRQFKRLDPELVEYVNTNAIELQVTNFQKIYVNWDFGIVETYCHRVNREYYKRRVNRVIHEALESAKAERALLPLTGTKNSLNIGLGGIVHEIVIPGSFLSVKIGMYDFTPKEASDTVESIMKILGLRPNVRFLNPYEAELMFKSNEEARKAYNTISTRFPDVKPKWNQIKQKNDSISLRFYLAVSSKVKLCDNDIKNFVASLLGEKIEGCTNIVDIKEKTPTSVDVILETYSILHGDAIYEKLTSALARTRGFGRGVRRVTTESELTRVNNSLRCTWKVSNRVTMLLRNSIQSMLRNVEITEQREESRVMYSDKNLHFPLEESYTTNFTQAIEFLEGTSFSRPNVPLFFNSAAHMKKLEEVEKNFGVAIIHDKFSQQYSLKIYGKVQDALAAMQDIDTFLENAETTVTDIDFSRKSGMSGLLLELLKTYGTNFHKLTQKRGIDNVKVLFSTGIVRISGDKAAVIKVEEEIDDIIDGCPHIGSSIQVDEDNTCCICFMTPSKNDSYRFSLCGHLICLHQCFRMLMVSSDFPLSCPREGCDSEGITVMDMFVAFTIDPNIKKNFMKNCLDHFLATGGGKNCPTINCNGIFIPLLESDDEDSRATCNVCLKDICLKCMLEYHQDVTCEEKKAGISNDLTVLLSKGILKKCPKCKVPIEKNGGCLRVQCRCGTQLCWYCLAAYNTSGEVYAHEYKCSAKR